MKIPNVTIQQLLEAGVHLGHKTFRWNPKMSKFIFGSKDSIHIIDLVQTLELTKVALQEIHKCVYLIQQHKKTSCRKLTNKLT